MYGRGKQLISILASIAAVIAINGQGCSKVENESQLASESATKSETSEDALLVLLTRAGNYSGQLQALNVPEAIVVSDDLEKGRTKIVDLLKTNSIGSQVVRQQIDLLTLNIVRAVETLLRLEINRVERESIARDADLSRRIDLLTAELGQFKNQVNQKFASVEDQISQLNNRLNALDDSLRSFKTATAASAAALASSISDLKQYTKEEITKTREMNNDLKAELIKQQATLDELFKSGSKVADIQARLCKTSNETRPVCTGAVGENPSQCCLTIDAVDCNEVFPNEIQAAARNQCNVIVSVIKNHDSQLKAIHEVDAKQTQLIDNLLSDVTNLDKRMSVVENQVDILEKNDEIQDKATDEIIKKLEDHEQRIVILEFKASRAEAAAALDERSELYLAWIARRSADISARYCSSNKDLALQSFDYQSARWNWQYCHEKLEYLVRAKELIQLAKAYTAGLQSLNVDTGCSAVIGGKPAESLSNGELVDPETFNAVTKQCTTGGQVLARAMLLNIVSMQNKIGPDFRTIAYMAKKAKIAQLIYLGKMASELSPADRAKFELVDPTSDALKTTLYGSVERVFKKRYVENRLRTVAGTFPEDPASMPASIAGFNVVYSHAEIESAADEYLARLKKLEVQGACQDCGWNVAGRNNTNRGGKARFAYPKDRESLCPVQNDDVVLKNADGKYYAYRLNYSGFEEQITPVLSSGAHFAIAQNDADMANGNFARCWYSSTVYKNGLGQAQLQGHFALRMTQPYGNTYAGRASCVKSTVVCMNREGDYVAPAGSEMFSRHLSGFDETKLGNLCKFNMGYFSTVRTRDVRPDELVSFYAFKGPVDDVTRTSIAKAKEDTTQLGSNYWMWKDVTVNYGVNNETLSKDTPFFVAPNARSTKAVREIFKVQTAPKVQECTPNNVPNGYNADGTIFVPPTPTPNPSA